MTDPRNIAHDKRVQQEKKHRHKEGAPGASQKAQPGRKPQAAPAAPEPEIAVPDLESPKDSEQMQG